MVGPLEGRVAVVTGASRGIGAAVAMRLATDGATVVVTHPGSDGPEEVLAAIRTGGHQCSAVEADNTDPAAVRAAIQQVAESHGRLDILVNNAGVIRIAPIDEMHIADFDLHFAVNVRGAFVASQEAARHMRSGGRIIMIGSCTADRMPFVGGSAYAMSKAAIAGMARGIARDLGGRGITVNTVQPGPTDTSLNPAAGPNADVQQQMLAIERFARADEIAGLVAYLASDQAAFVTGASLTIDGGYNA